MSNLVDEGLEKTIYDCLTRGLQDHVDSIPDDIKNLSERELEERFRLTPRLHQMRHRMWAQYEKCIAGTQPQIIMPEVYHAICSKQHFYKVISEPAICAWFMIPPSVYLAVIDEALDFAIKGMRQMLPNTLAKAHDDPEWAKILLNIAKFLDARSQGSPLQKIQQQSLHVHKNITAPSTPEQLREELQNLSLRIDSSQAAPARDVGSDV